MCLWPSRAAFHAWVARFQTMLSTVERVSIVGEFTLSSTVRRHMRLRTSRAVAGAALSVFQREGESDAENYAGGDEGAGGAVDYEGFGSSGVKIPAVLGFLSRGGLSRGFRVPLTSRGHPGNDLHYQEEFHVDAHSCDCEGDDYS